MTIVVPKPPGKCSAAKRRRGFCVTPHCRKFAPPGKGCCRTCQDRKWRAKHPEHHLWNNLKKSAKRRGIPFSVTLADFKEFCARENFVARVGTGPQDATVDRRDAALGYEKNNLRVLTNAENGRLGQPLGNTGHRQHYSPQEDPLAQ